MKPRGDGLGKVLLSCQPLPSESIRWRHGAGIRQFFFSGFVHDPSTPTPFLCSEDLHERIVHKAHMSLTVPSPQALACV
jgi:hypothetical protein